MRDLVYPEVSTGCVRSRILNLNGLGE